MQMDDAVYEEVCRQAELKQSWVCLQLAQLPSTRCLTMEEFEAAQRKQSEGADPEELTADAVEAEEEEEQQQGGAQRESCPHILTDNQKAKGIRHMSVDAKHVFEQ